MNYIVNIFELLSNKTVLHILEYFLERPTGKTYLAQLTKELGLAKGSIINALEKLQNASFLTREQIGKTILYSLDNSNTQVKELKRLFNLSQALEKLEDFRSTECEVYLYGSSARGENDEKSDMDILIISNKKDEVKNMLNKIKDERVKPMILTQLEYTSLARKDKPFYERLEKDKIKLI